MRAQLAQLAQLAQPSNTTTRIVPTARLWNQEKKILGLTGGIIDDSSTVDLT